MRTRLAFALFVALVAACLAVASAAVPAVPAEPFQLPAELHPFTSEPAPGLALEPIPLVARVDGALVYGAYCAQCHGENGHADGPLAARLAEPIPDLTALADEAGEVDRGAVRRAVAERHMMPAAVAETWRDVLAATYGERDAERMLTALVRHLESLQARR
jgi:hypothetical protein